MDYNKLKGAWRNKKSKKTWIVNFVYEDDQEVVIVSDKGRPTTKVITIKSLLKNWTQQKYNSDTKEFYYEEGGEVFDYRYKKGDSFLTKGNTQIITITKLEKANNLNLLPSYYLGNKGQKRYSKKFDTNIGKDELESLVDSGEWKRAEFEMGGEVCTYDFEGYEINAKKCKNEGVNYLLTGEYILVSRSLYNENQSLWLYYNYINRIAITLKECKEFSKQIKTLFPKMPLDIAVLKGSGKRKRSVARYQMRKTKEEMQKWIDKGIDVKPITFENYTGVRYCGVWTELVCCDKSWAQYFLDKNTNRPIPAFDPNDYYSYTTLIHELAHCLDFEYQLAKGKRPVPTHKKLFLRALYKILRACKDGTIKMAKTIDERAFAMQKVFATETGKKKFFVLKPL